MTDSRGCKRFEAQGRYYREGVLPPPGEGATIVEDSPIDRERYAGRTGVVLGHADFGMSAPMKVVIRLTVGHVVLAAKEAMAQPKM